MALLLKKTIDGAVYAWKNRGGRRFPAVYKEPKLIDFEKVLVSSDDVDRKDLVIVSCDASVKYRFATGIIGRLNKNGSLLFLRIVPKDKVPDINPDDSNFYETYGIKNTFEYLDSLGYKSHTLNIVNDNNDAVKAINEPIKFWNKPTFNPNHKNQLRAKELRMKIEEIDHLKGSFKESGGSVRVVGRIREIVNGVDYLSKYGSRSDEAFLWRAYEAIKREKYCFPLGEDKFDEQV